MERAGSGSIEAVRNGEAPYFGYTVERENGKLAFSAFGIADALGSGDLGAASGGKCPAPLGAGDRAALASGDGRRGGGGGHDGLTCEPCAGTV